MMSFLDRFLKSSERNTTINKEWELWPGRHQFSVEITNSETESQMIEDNIPLKFLQIRPGDSRIDVFYKGQLLGIADDENLKYYVMPLRKLESKGFVGSAPVSIYRKKSSDGIFKKGDSINLHLSKGSSFIPFNQKISGSTEEDIYYPTKEIQCKDEAKFIDNLKIFFIGEEKVHGWFVLIKNSESDIPVYTYEKNQRGLLQVGSISKAGLKEVSTWPFNEDSKLLVPGTIEQSDYVDSRTNFFGGSDTIRLQVVLESNL